MFFEQLKEHLFKIRSYLFYLFFSKGAHSAHSPFVYYFVEQFLNNKRHFYFFDDINNLHDSLITSNKIINKNDFGTGYKKVYQISVSESYRRSAITKPKGEILFMLSSHFQFKNGLELGTHFGLSAAYIAAANSNMKLITIEGCEETATVAKESFKYLKLENTQSITSEFLTQINTLIESNKKFDFIYFDGNHNYESTMQYFTLLLQVCHEKTVLVFDDIYWSRGMNKAWKEIVESKNTTLCIDIYTMGIVFLSKEFSKQYFLLKN
jgi:predicted O-methyltransferase YrrM